MAFGLFKKKKKDKQLIDPTQVQINQLTKGAFIDYNLESWEVTAVYEYDWGDGFFSDEFQLRSADEICYLSVEEDDGYECTITKKISVHEIDGEIAKHVLREEEPPMKVNYEGVTYYRQSEAVGYFRDKSKSEKHWSELVSWTYYDKAKELTLSIEQWGEKEFEAAQGRVVEEFEFSNILIP